MLLCEAIFKVLFSSTSFLYVLRLLELSAMNMEYFHQNSEAVVLNSEYNVFADLNHSKENCNNQKL